MSYKHLRLNEKSTADSIKEFDNESLVIFDDQCIPGVEIEGIQGTLLENYEPEKIILYAKHITDALKKVDNEGYVIENLERMGYLELYTPLVCRSEYIDNYFKEFEYWNLNKFIKLNEDKVEFYLTFST